MRTTLRTTIALLAAVATLSIAAVASAGSDPGLNPEPLPADEGGGAAGACMEGTADCVDTPGIVDGGGMAMCVEGVPDCDDMIVEPDPGTGQTEPGSAGDDPVASPPDDGAAGDPGDGYEPTITEPAPGTTTDPRPRPFDTATVAGDDVTVTIDFVSGVEPCYVLDHVDVDYAGDAVTITLFEGSDLSAGDVACIEIGVFKRTVITLDQPLAGRAIVDGAAA
jgi:hypothetical protein